jgi:hypothetical protein
VEQPLVRELLPELVAELVRQIMFVEVLDYPKLWESLT